MDNTGDYITYNELLVELFQSGSTKVTAKVMTLSNKTTNVAGDIYDFTGSPVPVPKIGDVVEQAGESDIIKSLPAANKIQITKTGASNLIVNGSANLLHSDSVPKKKGEDLIHQAMTHIDEKTGQFFNKRTGTFDLEGSNTPVLFLPVPVIEITKLMINGSVELTEGVDEDFVAFKGRRSPQDDRRNPRIKLSIGRGRDSIFSGKFTNRVFLKDALTNIEGSFGFLEYDGSTPQLIKKAVLILVSKDIHVPSTSSSSSSQIGPLKKIKVDIHEKEFFELKSETENDAGSTGSSEVDRIVAMYRSPIRISGSFMGSRSDGL